MARTIVSTALSLLVVAACASGPRSSSSAPVSSSASAASTAAGATAAGATAAPVPNASGSPAPTASATVTPGASAALEEPVFAFDGDARRVRLYRPPVMPAGKVPLLLFLHPSGETPAAAVTETRFDQVAAAEGFIAAFPPSKSGGWAAQVTPGLSDSAVDQIWLTNLLDRLLATEPIDPSRVFVAGFSKGAVMTERLACVLSDRIVAAVVVGGAPWIGDCRPTTPVSMLFVHGTADSTLRISGARQVADAWRSLDGCSPGPSPSPMSDAATVQLNEACRDATVVEFVTVQNGAHAWFTEPDTTAIAWDFLAKHARR